MVDDGRSSSPVGGVVIALVAIAVVAGLVYGYILGEGQRVDSEAAPVTVPDTSMSGSTTTVPPLTSVATSLFEEIRPRPGYRPGRPPQRYGNNVTEYVNPNIVRDVAEDAEGYIWAVGPGGVVQWDVDDRTYVTHRNANGDSFSGAREVVVGADGTVWVTTDWGVALWSGREWVESRFPPGTSHGDGMVVTADGKLGVVVAVPAESSQWESDYEIHWGEAPFSGNVSGWAMGSRHKPDLVAGPDGDLWALVRGEVWRLEDGLWAQPFDIEHESLAQIAFDASGMFWGTDGRRVWRGDGDSLVEVTAADGGLLVVPDDGYVDLLMATSDPGAWIAISTWDTETSRGSMQLVRLDAGGPAATLEIPEWTGSLPVFASDGSLWFTGAEGVLRFDGASWSTLSIDDQTPIAWPRSVTVDEAGHVWVVASSELWRFDGEHWVAISWPATDWDESAWTAWVESGPDGSMWAHTQGRAARWDGSTWAEIPWMREAKSWQRCQSRAVAPDGSLWLACNAGTGNQIDRFDGSSWISIPVTPSEVQDLAIDPAGTAWIATLDGIYRLEGDEWIEMLGGLGFTTLLVTPDGEVWAGKNYWCCDEEGSGDLWRYRNGVWSRMKDDVVILALAGAEDGIVWALVETVSGDQGTQSPDRELWRIGDEVALTYFKSPDLYSLDVGPDGTAWVVGDQAIYHVSNPGVPPST